VTITMRIHRVLLGAATAVCLLGCSREPVKLGTKRPRPRTGYRMGTEHPVVVQQASLAGGWAVICQARRDTDGDDRISVLKGFLHGTLSGDEMLPYLALGPGPGEPIDAFVGAHPSGHYLVFVQQGRLWLVDAWAEHRQRVDLTRLGARTADDNNASMPQPAVHFDPRGERLVFVRQGPKEQSVALLDLTTRRAKTIYRTSHVIWRAHFNEDGNVRVFVIKEDTNDNGIIDLPRVHTTRAARGCRGSAAVSTTLSRDGDDPREVIVPVEAADREVAPEKAMWGSGCADDGRPILLHLAGGEMLVASAAVSTDVHVGPVEWVRDSGVHLCQDRAGGYRADNACDDSKPALFCAIREIPLGSAAWALDRGHLWVDQERVALADGPQEESNTFASGRVSVSGTADDDVWALNSGRLSHWDGNNWTPRELPLYLWPVAVVADTRSRAWVRGHTGKVVQWNGRAWTSLPPTGVARTTDAHFDDEQLWVASAAGAVLRYVQGRWQPTDGLPGAPIFAIWAASPSDAWAATREGEVWTWDGARWRLDTRLVPNGLRFAEYLLDIRGKGPRDVWVSSSAGRLFHWDGAHWTTHDAGVNWEFHEILGVWDDQLLLRSSSAIVRFDRALLR
jgi:hypothetical protein